LPSWQVGMNLHKTHISSTEEPPSTLVSISFLPFLALTIFPFATATRSSSGRKQKAVGYSPLKDTHTRRLGSQEKEEDCPLGSPGAGDLLMVTPLRWLQRRRPAPELCNRRLDLTRRFANFWFYLAEEILHTSTLVE